MVELEKIPFVNNEEPDLSAETLNEMQDNIEDAIQEVETNATNSIEALQEENLYLNSLVEQAFDKKEVEGEELSINDTINAKMEVGLLGNTTQKKTTGKQLFDKDNTTIEIGTITSNGTFENFNQRLRAYYIKVEENTTYTLSTNSSDLQVVPYFYDTNKEFLSFYNGWKNFPYTFTTPANTEYLVLLFKNSNDTPTISMIGNLQLELGSTASSYEKYTGGLPAPNPDYPQEVHTVTGNNTIEVCNKNLAQLENGSLWDNSGAERNLANNVRTKFIKFNKDMTITPTIFSSLTTRYNQYILYDKNKNFIALNYFINNTPITTANSEVKYIRFKMAGPVNGTMTINDINFMVVNGSTPATEYTPHQSQTFNLNLGNIELNGIGDYKDYFYKNGDKWYKKEYIGKVVLDGSETYVSMGWLGGRFGAKVSINNLKQTTDTSQESNILSNYYTTYAQSNLYNLSVPNSGISNRASQSEIIIRNDNLSTITDLQTWLSTHNTEVYYVKETATDIEITDTTLIEQLEELKTAMSYAGQTNISQINDDIPFILKITALASYNSRIVALENAILNANRSTPVENTRKSNEVIEEPKEEVVDDNKDEPKEEIKEER